MKLGDYFQSMAGRLFVFLLIGVVSSASLALAMADSRRNADLHRIRVNRIVDRVDDFMTVASHASGGFRAELLAEGVPGIRRATGTEKIEGADAELGRALNLRNRAVIKAEWASSLSCFGSTATAAFVEQFNCWVVTTRMPNGEEVPLQIRGPHGQREPLPGLDPLFLLISALAVAALAFVSARMAAAPLGDLSRAAQALGGDLDAVPLPERGPLEVRKAAAAFNTMQARLRNYMIERTQMLASITHDLQTPMTRLRLRLEKVEDPALRSRLIDDLGAMQALIRDGLDYSRSNQINEPFATLSLDQLLEILVDDAADAGKSATLVKRCGCDIEARPRTLQRCLANLLDNALKYGGSAEISAEWVGREVRVRIRDHGPGIPADQVDQVLKPFVRLGTLPAGADGVGLGLAIAKNLAESNEAELVLRNHSQGGLDACLILRRGVGENPTAAPVRRPAAKRSARPRVASPAKRTPKKLLPDASG